MAAGAAAPSSSTDAVASSVLGAVAEFDGGASVAAGLAVAQGGSGAAAAEVWLATFDRVEFLIVLAVEAGARACWAAICPSWGGE